MEQLLVEQPIDDPHQQPQLRILHLQHRRRQRLDPLRQILRELRRVLPPIKQQSANNDRDLSASN
jgi:hypothetical protein